MTLTVRPFLMFQGGLCREALDFYAANLPGMTLGEIAHFPDAANAHLIMTASFQVGDQMVMCNDSPIPHAFGFTPSLSLFVTVDEEAEVDRLADALAAGGAFLMPAGDYGFSRRFAWVNDRFGVSWQVNCP